MRDVDIDLIVVNYELAWAAGFWDGEGCASVYLRKTIPPRYTSQASVTQIHRATLERFDRAVGGLGKIYGPYDTKSGKSPQYCYKIGSFGNIVLLSEMLWSYLSQPKKDQFSSVIEAHRSTALHPEDVRRRRSESAKLARARKAELHG